MILPRVLALALPLGLVAGLLAWAGAPTTTEPGETVVRVREELDRNGADVVLLGNSTSHSDLDRARLSELLDGARISNPRVAASAAPAWLAVLESQVVARGMHPRLVVVYGTLETLLGWRPSGARLARVEELVGDEESTVSRRVFDRGHRGSSERALAARATVPRRLVDGIRDRAVGLFMGGEGASLAAKGAATAAPALDALFGEKAKLRSGETTRVMPVMEAETSGAFATTRTAVESLVPDLVRVAHSAGARIVVVRGPDAPGREPTGDLGDQAEPLRALLDRLGAGYADLSYLRMPPSAYRDTIHMNAVGQELVTDALASELDRIDPLAPEAMPPSRPPVRALDARREGTVELPKLVARLGDLPCRWAAELPELAAVSDSALLAAGLGMVSPVQVVLGEERLSTHTAISRFPEGCGAAASLRGPRLAFSTANADQTDADVRLDLDPALPLNPATDDETWWVYPGTQLRFSVSAPGAIHLHVATRVFGAAEVTVTANGQPVPLTGTGGLKDGELTLDVGNTPLTIDVAASGGFVVLEALDVGEPGRERPLAGSFAPRVALRLGWRGDAVPVNPATPDAGSGPRVLEVPELSVVSDDRLLAAGVARCSVLEVKEGADVIEHGVGARVASGNGRARVAFTRGQVELPDGVGPVQLALAGTRICDAGSWLYPGDRQAGTSRGVRLARLRSGASDLELVATAFGGSDAPLHVSLVTPTATLLEADVPIAALNGKPIRIPLSQRMVGRPGSLTLRLDNPTTGGFVLVHAAALFDDTAQ